MTFRRSFIAVLGTSMLITGCGKPSGSRKPIAVETSEIRAATFAPTVTAVSRLESTTDVKLSPETDGRVVKILAKEGQIVKAGQTILELDNVQQTAALDSASAAAKKDKLNAERYEFLFSQGAASAKTRDQYVTAAIESRDNVLSQAATRGYKFVRAPINGVIGELDSVKLGDYVEKGQTITGIVDNSTLWTLMQVPASQANQVKLGQSVRLTTQTTPPVTGEGSVVFISPYYGNSGDETGQNTLMVKAAFPNLTGQLKARQYVKTEIIIGKTESLSVPVQAVFMQAEQPFVYVVVPLSQALPKIKASTTVPEKTKKKLESLPGNTPIVVQRSVKLGKLENNLYTVHSGLKQGEQVAISNTVMLRSGMPVKVAPPSATATPTSKSGQTSESAKTSESAQTSMQAGN